jgi:hypothetical protein
MASPAELERRLVNAWVDLAFWVDTNQDMPCLLPDGSEVDAIACRNWIQESIYSGFNVRVDVKQVDDQWKVAVSRSPD